MLTKDEGPGSDAGPLEEAEPAAENLWSEPVSISLWGYFFWKYQTSINIKNETIYMWNKDRESVCFYSQMLQFYVQLPEIITDISVKTWISSNADIGSQSAKIEFYL